MNSLLFVTTIPATSSFFVPIAHHLQAQGWQVDAMANGISSNPKCLETFDCVWDVNLSRNPLDPRNLLVAKQQIRKILAEKHYDIVNVSTPVAAFVTRYALNDLRKNGLKLIYTAQGFHFYRGGAAVKNSIFRTLEAIAAPWTDYLVVVNREDEAAAKRIIPSERVRYIPGTGVNLDRYNPNNIAASEIEQVRENLGLKPDNPLFLSVAEFIPRKHHRDILIAFTKLNKPEVHLAFAGDGRLLEQMKQLASKLGIEDRVHFLGLRKDIPILMRASTATILASEQEGLPNCVMESICLETPVIGTDIRGTRDLLEEGNGLLFQVGDVDGLVGAMTWVLDRPEEVKMMGKRGRERMAAYGLRYILKQYEDLYAEALEKENYAAFDG